MSTVAPASGTRSPLQRAAGVLGNLLLAVVVVLIPPTVLGLVVTAIERVLAMFRG